MCPPTRRLEGVGVSKTNGESVFWAVVGGLLLLAFAANAVWGA